MHGDNDSTGHVADDSGEPGDHSKRVRQDSDLAKAEKIAAKLREEGFDSYATQDASGEAVLVCQGRAQSWQRSCQSLGREDEETASEEIVYPGELDA